MPNLNWLNNPTVLIPFLIWSILWKGIALWQSAARRQLSWFIIILLINTFGILEIIYILYLNRFDLGSTQLLSALTKFTKSIRQKSS